MRSPVAFVPANTNEASDVGVDVGLADLITGGLVAVKSGAEIQKFGENGVTFTDGSEMNIDAVIFA